MPFFPVAKNTDGTMSEHVACHTSLVACPWMVVVGTMIMIMHCVYIKGRPGVGCVVSMSVGWLVGPSSSYGT
jgi:hypothetical protein